MSILFFDGCGEYYNAAQIERVWDGTTIGSNLPAIETIGGRRSGACITLGGNLEFIQKGFVGSKTMVIGWAGRMQIPASNTSFMQVWGSQGRHLSFQVTSNGAIRITNSTVEIAISADDVVVDDVFQYYEFKFTIDPTTGIVEARVDGVEVLNETSQDTFNDGSELAYGIIFRCPAISNGHRIDDVYILNDSGGAPYNDFLGDIRVDALLPTGDGALSQFDTATPSSNHWENVDDNPADDDTSYNESATANDEDLFTFPALPVITPAHTVFGVKVVATLNKSDAGIQDFRMVCRPDATSFDSGTDLPCQTDFRFHEHIFEEDPDASAPWTTATIDASEFGVKVI